MPDQGIAQIIFPDSKDLETFLKEQGSYDLHEDLLKYELLPDKIKMANKILSPKGFGLFLYPNSGDFYALFIGKIENITKILQEEVLLDDRIPFQERCIKYYR
ncbi:hypothetical protein C1I58_25000 [Bacillus sp. PIC28]|nr:hypothetical protein C1I58_25000 [Bacillus sp. PIC28]